MHYKHGCILVTYYYGIDPCGEKKHFSKKFTVSYIFNKSEFCQEYKLGLI